MNSSTFIHRRQFLAGSAAILVAVTAGGIWRAWDKGVFSTGKGPAYEPWRTWNAETRAGGPLALVRAAILAANPHNIQPWLFRITANQIELHADPNRSMGSMDALLREKYIGLGCALENLLLAARANGYDARVAAANGTGTLVATIDLAPGRKEASDLYLAIPHRHTNRAAYDTKRSVSAETLRTMAALRAPGEEAQVRWFSTVEERQRVGDLLIRATEAIIADSQQMADDSAWYRFDWDVMQQERDGMTLDAQGIAGWMRAVGKMFPSMAEDPKGRYWLKAMKETQVPTASAFGLLVVPDAQNMQHRLTGGRLYQRLHLWATAQGLAMQPLNQLTERADREQAAGLERTFGKALRELVGNGGGQALMSFRVGYPTVTALPAPRRGIEQVRM